MNLRINIMASTKFNYDRKIHFPTLRLPFFIYNLFLTIQLCILKWVIVGTIPAIKSRPNLIFSIWMLLKSTLNLLILKSRKVFTGKSGFVVETIRHFLED